MDAYLAYLSERVAVYFNRAELQALCLRLDFNFDSLPAAGLGEQARELVLALARRERLPDLLDELRRERSTVEWPPVPPGFRPPAEPGAAPVAPTALAAPPSKYQIGSVAAGNLAIGDNAQVTVHRGSGEEGVAGDER